MVEFDELENRMVLKLVYYGPAMSGKTTNLLQLHDVLDQENRGELTVLDTKNDSFKSVPLQNLGIDGDWQLVIHFLFVYLSFRARVWRRAPAVIFKHS